MLSRDVSPKTLCMKEKWDSYQSFGIWENIMYAFIGIGLSMTQDNDNIDLNYFNIKMRNWLINNIRPDG